MFAELESLPKTFHVIPDFVIAVFEEGKRVEWGKLRKFADNVILIVEAKLSLSGETKYESIETVEKQVYAYRKLLKDKPAIIAIHNENRYATSALSRGGDIITLDGVNPDNPRRAEEFKKHVKNIVLKGVHEV